MTKGMKTALAIGSGFALAIGGYVIYKKFIKADNTAAKVSDEEKTSTPTVTAPKPKRPINLAANFDPKPAALAVTVS